MTILEKIKSKVSQKFQEAMLYPVTLVIDTLETSSTLYLTVNHPDGQERSANAFTYPNDRWVHMRSEHFNFQTLNIPEPSGDREEEIANQIAQVMFDVTKGDLSINYTYNQVVNRLMDEFRLVELDEGVKIDFRVTRKIGLDCAKITLQKPNGDKKRIILEVDGPMIEVRATVTIGDEFDYDFRTFDTRGKIEDILNHIKQV